MKPLSAPGTSIAQRVLSAAGILSGLGLYLAYSSRFYPGYFGDDAAYLLTAKSLLHGAFRATYLVHNPPETHYFPGFPFALSPFLLFFDPRHVGLKGVVLLCTGGSVLLMRALFHRWVRWEVLAPALGLYMLNPVTAMYATSFMSEPFFVVMVLATFCLLERVIRKDTSRDRWILGTVLGWTMLTRPIGVIVWISTGAGLLLSRRLKAFGISQGLSMILWLLFLARNYVLSQSPNNYLKFWGSELHSLSTLWPLVQNAWTVFQYLLTGYVLSAGRWVPIHSIWSLALALGLGALWVTGVVTCYKRLPAYRGLLVAIALYAVLYFGVHGLWLAFDDRYALPLLPFLFPFIILGIAAIIPRGIMNPLFAAIIGFSFLPGLIAENVVSVAQTLSPNRPAQSLLPRTTLQWIEQNIPANELISTHTPARLCLWTDRQGVGRPVAHDREEARFLLLNADMHFVFLQSESPLSLAVDTQANDAANAERFNAWVTHWPEVFELKYQNASEGTVIYALQPNDRFCQIYKEYVAARSALLAGRDDGYRQLEHVVAQEPRLASALNLYGASLMLRGKNKAQAEQSLKDALAIWPDYPLALVNLARLYAGTHRSQQAQRLARRARQLIQTQETGFRYLLPTIDALETLGIER